MDKSVQYNIEKQNSFSGRYAGTGSDIKIYFNDEEELKKGIDTAIEGARYLRQKVEELQSE